ncbi:MAG: bi-domain-containing oxidoreductase [Alphaproteobacteria bacterium]|nr:bi-domain-containing oxidoreductase [Alphaproteobacteria bacterium]
MKQVLIKGGGVIVEDVPAPQVGEKNILVRVEYSCISAGTELAGVSMSGMPLYRRALKQPENVARVLDMMRDQGVKRTMDRVRGKLSAGSPTGYSAAGRIIAIGSQVDGFSVGDRVACAGAGIANHAELIDVPVNLAVRIPDEVSTQHASTVTLGAIALQGVRRAAPTLGETVVVVGLGVLGQMTAQMLAANGCRVIGIDLDERRLGLAREKGIWRTIDPTDQDYVAQVRRLTDGHGADAVIVTAATPSDEVISQAFQACRKKGRAILVGDVGLALKRADFYAKELDFLVSTSYGPGRYDPVYEEGGQDYPIAFVRWTENRNMAAYLDLIASGAMNLDGLIAEPYAVKKANDAYSALKSKDRSELIVLLEYDDATPITRRVDLLSAGAGRDIINVGLAGAGGFAQGMHLPNMVKLRQHYRLRAVMSRTGSNAKAIATQYEANYATTDYEELLADNETDLIIIATRHNLHAPMVLKALEAGKSVFVEKPLALTEAELLAIESFYKGLPAGKAPLLMTGFNRRFSPAMQAIRKGLSERTTPVMATYRMNAGYIPTDHWVHTEEGGGRNIGEACHIYDTFRSLVGAPIADVTARSIQPQGKQWRRNDNFTATLSFADGSVCSLTYTALGDKSHPKERMEVFADGKVAELDDYQAVRFAGLKKAAWSSGTSQKGQLEELEALAEAMKTSAAWPITLEEQLEVSRAALSVEAQIAQA